MEMQLESVVGVLDEPYSGKPAQLSSHTTGPPGYIGCTLFQPMYTGGLYDYSAERDLLTIRFV
jgi:hypothetical protein